MHLARIKSNNKFKEIFSTGVKVVTKPIVIYKLANGASDINFGVVAAKKIFARAVDRNYAKRLLRCIVRENKGGIIGYDVVLVARKKLIETPYHECSELFRKSIAEAVRGE